MRKSTCQENPGWSTRGSERVLPRVLMAIAMFLLPWAARADNETINIQSVTIEQFGEPHNVLCVNKQATFTATTDCAKPGKAWSCKWADALAGAACVMNGKISTAKKTFKTPDDLSENLYDKLATFELYKDGVFQRSLSTPFTVAEVRGLGFEPSETWAVGTTCDVEKHKVQLVPDVSPSVLAHFLTFSIEGEAHGATIDPDTHKITPSADNSGEITVRATAPDNLHCFADAKLLIKAHPTGVHRSQVTPITNPDYVEDYYGGDWTHTFMGTGGSLEGVQVSEKVVAIADPFTSLGPPVEPGRSIWILDRNGRMDRADTYAYWMLVVDVNQFLPSPPKAGLPQTATSRQRYVWRCPLDEEWIEFTGPENIDWTLMFHEDEGGRNLIFRTSAYGEERNHRYNGPVLMNPP